MSLFAGFLFSMFTKVDPVTKWKVLRSAALTMESEVFKFRTLTGKYKNKVGTISKNATKTLYNNIDLTVQSIISNGTITSSSL